MPVDPNALFEAVMNGLSKIPSGIFAALLLAGPTAVWLILRFANPREAPSRFGGVAVHPPWVCPGCRSLNEDRASSCYRCSLARTDAVLPLIAQAAAVDASEAGIAVGPGMPAGSPPGSWLGLDVDDAPEAAADAGEWTAEPVAALVGAAPDALQVSEPLLLEPRPKVARRRSSRSARRD